MSRTQLRRRAYEAAARLISEAARGTEIFGDDEDGPELRNWLHKIAEELFKESRPRRKT